MSSQGSPELHGDELRYAVSFVTAFGVSKPKAKGFLE